MDFETDETGELVDLGTASTDTEGAMGRIVEPVGLWRHEGISDE